LTCEHRQIRLAFTFATIDVKLIYVLVISPFGHISQVPFQKRISFSALQVFRFPINISNLILRAFPVPFVIFKVSRIRSLIPDVEVVLRFQ